MKPCLRLGDHEGAPFAHDALRLEQHRLDLARIALLRRRDPDRSLRGLDRVEADHAPLHLRDGLLREHQHVAVDELLERHDHRREIVPLPDLREAADGDDRDRAGHSTPLIRTPA